MAFEDAMRTDYELLTGKTKSAAWRSKFRSRASMRSRRRTGRSIRTQSGYGQAE